MTKSEIRTLESNARTARLFASEQVAKAAYEFEDGSVEGFQRCMSEAARLAIVAGKMQIQARDARRALAA